MSKAADYIARRQAVDGEWRGLRLEHGDVSAEVNADTGDAYIRHRLGNVTIPKSYAVLIGQWLIDTFGDQ